MSTTDNLGAGAAIKVGGPHGAALHRFEWQAFVHGQELIVNFSTPLARLFLTPYEARDLGIAMFRGALSLQAAGPEIVAALELLDKWTREEGAHLARRLLGPSGGPAG